MIPVMRVNYTMAQIAACLFVSESSHRRRERLEEMIRIFFSVDNVMLTSSARCALYMIVRSLPQHKVIVPAYTCEVVIEAVMLAGKEVVFAPMDKGTLNVSEYPAIDSDTIVVATHQYGRPCEMKTLAEKCRESGAVLIEDCAGSLGSRIDGKLTGTFGDYAVFSFSASKTLHSPTKGGFILAKNKELMEKIVPLDDVERDGLAFKVRQLVKAAGFCMAKTTMFSGLVFGVSKSTSRHSEDAYLTDMTYHRGLYEWQAGVVLKEFENIEALLMERRKLYGRYYKEINNPLVTCLMPDRGGYACDSLPW